jgi:hypothetical protein
VCFARTPAKPSRTLITYFAVVSTSPDHCPANVRACQVPAGSDGASGTWASCHAPTTQMTSPWTRYNNRYEPTKISRKPSLLNSGMTRPDSGRSTSRRSAPSTRILKSRAAVGRSALMYATAARSCARAGGVSLTITNAPATRQLPPSRHPDHGRLLPRCRLRPALGSAGSSPIDL